MRVFVKICLDCIRACVNIIVCIINVKYLLRWCVTMETGTQGALNYGILYIYNDRKKLGPIESQHSLQS